MAKKQFTQRDISWLSFNARVLQEANDPEVPLKLRIKFLGIFSNNMDEFFRVRVATLKRMLEYAEKQETQFSSRGSSSGDLRPNSNNCSKTTG